MWAPIISYYTCSGILCDFQAAGEPNVSAAQEGLGSTLWRQGALGPRPKLVSAVLLVPERPEQAPDLSRLQDPIIPLFLSLCLNVVKSIVLCAVFLKQEPILNKRAN